MEGYHGSVGGATAGLAVGTVTGLALTPGLVTTIPCDALEENRKKRKSNDLRQRQYYEGDIIQEVIVIDAEHNRRRQRTEAGPSSSGDGDGRRMMEGEWRDSSILNRKRCREEGAETWVDDRGQGQGSETVRARTGRAGVKRVVRLAEVVDVLRGQPGSGSDGVTRGTSVQWIGGRWHIEVEGGERGNSEVSGGASTGGVTIDSSEEEERRLGVWVIEAAIAETTALRRGYTMSAAWDEGAMIQAMSRMDNPTLRWRYGDVVDEEQGGEEAQHAREER